MFAATAIQNVRRPAVAPVKSYSPDHGPSVDPEMSIGTSSQNSGARNRGSQGLLDVAYSGLNLCGVPWWPSSEVVSSSSVEAPVSI